MTFTALSIIQPWPWLILRPDVTDPAARFALAAAGQMKDHENRDWSTNVRGWVIVHASGRRLAAWDYRAAQLFAAQRGVEVPLREALPYGAAVGAMRIDAVETRSASVWATGPGFKIGATVPFSAPVVCTGSLKFFRLPAPGEATAQKPRVAAELAAALRSAGLARDFGLEETA